MIDWEILFFYFFIFKMRAREKVSGGRPRVPLGQPRRSFSSAERYTEGEQGPARVAEIRGGDRGDWSVVRSRKRKATEPDHRGQDRSRGSEWYGGSARVVGKDWQKGPRTVSFESS